MVRGDFVPYSEKARIKERNKTARRKIVLGIMVVVAIIVFAIMIEKSINGQIEDVVIEKSTITTEKASFIPLKQLDTNIIVVQASDMTYRIAFDDCLGCYYEGKKHSGFENNKDNTGLICKNCKREIIYDDMGFLLEESMPYPIPESEIISDNDKFVIPAKYLEGKAIILEKMRNGKIENAYSEN